MSSEVFDLIKFFWKHYNGKGFYLYLFLGCMVLLLFLRERRKYNRYLFWYCIGGLILYWIPYTAKIIMDYAIGKTVYWRMFWLLPITFVIAYFAVSCKKKVRKPESEWFRVENTHEPIIDKEVFYRVQEQIKSRRRQTKEKATPIFAGLVKCADCGWSMRFATNKANKTPYSYYACSYYGQFGKGTCSMHYIRYDVLYQAVLERLQYWAKAVQQDEEKVLHKIQKVGNAERIREKKKKASALKKAENRQNEIDRLFAKMYEDRACEKITERNFIMLSGKYQKEQIELEQQITNLREELSKMEQDMIGAEKWIELIKEYSVPKELTAPLLNAMIEKILIHEATTNEENERIQEIEIYYRFIGKVD